MKRVEAYVRRETLDAVLAALMRVGYPGITVMQIEGNGRQKGIEQHKEGQDVYIPLLPKAKLEIIVRDDELETLIDEISRTVRTGHIGDGKIFVSDITDAVRIRTGERGEAALI